MELLLSSLKNLPNGTRESILSIILLVLIWIAKELWDSQKKDNYRKSDLLQQNTLALVELRVEVKALKEMITPLVNKIEIIEEDLHDAKRSWRKHDQ